MSSPLIVRVLLSRNWNAAFQLVWTECFKVAAADMGLTAPTVDVVMGASAHWNMRRAVCLRMGARCAEVYDLPELACCWAALAIDPGWPEDDEPALKFKRARAFMPVLFSLADAIADDPSLLDVVEFAGVVQAWKFMCQFGIRGHDDPILATRTAASMFEIDREAILGWAIRLHGSDA